jgi:microsomal dipeptidase-like Zn-dependent dipeptidase
MRWIAFIVVAGLVAIGVGTFVALPGIVERELNPVTDPPPYTVSAPAASLHATLDVADMHADSLLWGRDLLRRGVRGHVDVPRLIEGHYALQVFSLPTKTPRGLNYDTNDDKSDNIFWLAVVQRWPPRTWYSLTERALYQAERLHAAAAASGGRFTVIHSANELRAYRERRRTNPTITAGLLSIEGAHALDGNLANLDRLYEAGYRMMSPSHFFDNDIGGSSAGVNKIGLTDKGRELVRRMEARHMIVDLAHASAKTIDDVLALATKPVVVSHTGVKATCDNNRNLTSDQVRRIAASGGLIGIGFWDTASCGHDARAIANTIRVTVGLVGVEHVALGSDFDGAVEAPFDASGVARVTEALLAGGMTAADIRLVMGGNVLRFLESELP